jgi:hypothetical protein
MKLHEILNINAYLEDDQFDYPKEIFQKHYVIDEKFSENLSIGLKQAFPSVDGADQFKLHQAVMQAISTFNEIEMLTEETRIYDDELNEFFEMVEHRLQKEMGMAFVNNIRSFCERKKVPRYPYIIKSPSDWERYQ